MARTKIKTKPATSAKSSSSATTKKTPGSVKPSIRSASGSATATATAAKPAATRSRKQNQIPTGEAIANRAYEIWLRNGCPAGQDLENWTQAERELMRA